MFYYFNALLKVHVYCLGMSVNKPYRSGIVSVFFHNRKVLVCKRKRSNTDEWQFPQGGLKEGETEEHALFREVLEELGNNEFRVLNKSDSLVRYEFPKDMKEGKLAQKYRGQQHRWFLCEYENGMKPDLEQASDDDFEDLAWVDPMKALEMVVEWKRPAYKLGLGELGLEIDDL
jgi:putative (di)nucleoside polyphosphate hydrolase